MYKAISPQTFYLPSPSFHKEIDTLFLDNTIIKLVIEAPRGTAKSSKVISKIIHHGIWDNGDKVVVIQSKTQREAKKRLSKIKNVFEYSKVFRDLFDREGFAIESNAITWREDKIVVRLRHPFTREISTLTIGAIGTGQQARGVLEDDTRITLYIIDDPDDEDNTLTKDSMDKNFNKYLGNVAGLDMRNGRVIIIGTPIREGCIVERLRGATGYTTRRYQAYTEDNGEISVLWPEMYSYKWLMDKKRELEELGALSKFYSEYMCEIVGDEDRLFKKEYLRFYEGELLFYNSYPFMKITHEGENEYDIKELTEPKIFPCYTFVGVDPASSTKQTADYSVTFPIAWTGEKVFVLDYFHKRVTPTNHAEQIINMTKTHKFLRGHIETVGYQEMLRDYLRKRFKEEKIMLSGLETKFNPRTEKSLRLETMHPLFYNRKVWVKKSHTEFINEMLMYPRGKNDDLLDGFYYATRKLIAPSHTVDGTRGKQLTDDEIISLYHRDKKNKPIGYLGV